MDYLEPIGLTDSHKEFVIERLAMNRPVTEIKQQFDQYYAPLRIKGDTIDYVKKRYPDLIKEKRKKIVNNPNSVALAHSTFRLMLAQWGAEKAAQDQLQRTVRCTGDDGKEYLKEVWGPDFQALAKFIDLAFREEVFQKKLKLEKIVKGISGTQMPEDSGYRPTTVQTGFEDDEFEDPVDESLKIDG